MNGNWWIVVLWLISQVTKWATTRKQSKKLHSWGGKSWTMKQKRGPAKNLDKKSKTNQKKEGNWSFFSCQKDCSPVPVAGNFGNVAEIWNPNFWSGDILICWHLISLYRFDLNIIHWPSLFKFLIFSAPREKWVWTPLVRFNCCPKLRFRSVATSQRNMHWYGGGGRGVWLKLDVFNCFLLLFCLKALYVSSHTRIWSKSADLVWNSLLWWCYVHEIAFREILFSNFQHPVYYLLNFSDTQKKIFCDTKMKEIWSEF